MNRLNAIEQEAIILNSAWKMIDEMVTRSVFSETGPGYARELLFHSSEHARLFLIILTDFLSSVRGHRGNRVPLGLKEQPRNGRPYERTFLYHLKQVCENPQVGSDSSSIEQQVDAFADWLEFSFVAPRVNLPDINIVSDIEVHRYKYLTICGNIKKHNLARLSIVVSQIRELLNQSGHSVNESDAYLVADNFCDWFFDNIFLYHAPQIAEFLNGIRCAIYKYLLEEYRRSYRVTSESGPTFEVYRYDVPEEIQDTIAYAMYWEVMNRVRAQPSMDRFVVSDVLKLRY